MLLGQGLRGVGAFRLGARAASVFFWLRTALHFVPGMPQPFVCAVSLQLYTADVPGCRPALKGVTLGATEKGKPNFFAADDMPRPVISS